MRPIISYLLSHYPAVSHTFFLNEIRHLRSCGLDVRVASINASEIPQTKLTLAEKEELKTTSYIKSRGFLSVIADNLILLASRPYAYFSALIYAMSLSNGSPLTLLYRLFYFLEAVIIVRWMQRNKSGHLHIHFGSEVATVGIIAKKLGDITLSLTIHGSDEFYDAPGFHLTEKINQADFIFCISHYTSSQLMRLSDYSQWHKIVVAPLGVDIDKFHPRNHRPHRPEKPETSILCVGRLNAAKGIHLLIHAVARMEKTHDFHLMLVGDGEEKESLKALVNRLNLTKKVTFAGAVNQDEIIDYYRDTDIFCLPSFAEGVPIVLMEAMALGIPCVTSRITGIPELIRDEIDGVLVNAGDTTDLSRGLKQLIDAPDLCESIGKSARARVVTNYNLATNFDHLAILFNQRLTTPELIEEDEDLEESVSTPTGNA